jgi:preprotein translocase subunit SecG
MRFVAILLFNDCHHLRNLLARTDEYSSGNSNMLERITILVIALWLI